MPKYRIGCSGFLYDSRITSYNVCYTKLLRYRLGVYIARFGNGTAGRIALGNEYGRFHFSFVVAVEMHPAIAQLAVVEAYLFGSLACQFLDTRNGRNNFV